MGFLILKNVIASSQDNREACWYAPVRHMSGGWHVEWDVAFPFKILMHLDVLSDSESRRWEIRRWIERNLPCPVLYSYKEMNYRFYYGADPNIFVPFSRTFERRHGYHQFQFEEMSDATFFKLRFSDWVSTSMSNEHPRYPEGEGHIRFDPSRNIA